MKTRRPLSAGLPAAVVLVAAVLVAGAARPQAARAQDLQQAPAPSIHFKLLARTGVKLNSLVWTGSQLLYVENTKNTVWSAPAAGLPVRQFAQMPAVVEETRCVLSPGTHGFAPGAIFCHAPDHRIYEISADGSSVQVLATLPAPSPPSDDGALAFDDVGKFGYTLVAATGRSGATTPAGGEVYTIDAQGKVTRIGGYHGPGGADEVIIAPAGFGSIAGEAVLTVDAGPTGSVVAMGPDGRPRVLARLPDGPNPIAVVPPSGTRRTGIAAGLYVTDDVSTNVFFAAASQFAPFAGDIVVGSEIKAYFWIVKPNGTGFVFTRVRHNLRGGKYSLESATWVG